MQKKVHFSEPVPHIHRTVLANGLTVIAVENPAADIIAARIYIRAGSRWEPKGKAGLAHLLAAVITKGTEKLSSWEIAEKVESVGASLGTDAASDYFLLSIKTVSADFANILNLAGEILRSPTFPESEVELERRLAIQDIRSQQEQPFSIAFDRLRQAMYRDHPYSFSSLGTEETVANLNSAQLQEYHQTYFRPDNIIISLAGRIAPEDAVDAIAQVFGDWEVPPTPLSPLLLPAVLPQASWSAIPQATQQSIVMLGYLAASVQEEDYVKLKLLSTYLGNGLSSRLFVELREKRGLAYEVSAFYPTRLDASQFVVYMGTAPENTAIALEGLRAEVARLSIAPLDEEELQASKNKLLGQYALGKQTNSQLAQIFGWYEIIGLGIEFDHEFVSAVSAITAAEAQEAAIRCFVEPCVVLVGPETAIASLVPPTI